ncbi:MAG: DNA repair protein RecO [Myxococcota bacterium]
MAVFSCEAILLRAVDYGESDQIVHLLTADSGRMTAIAKGARRSHRRFPGTLDVFNHLSIRGRARPRAAMAFLEGAKLLDPFLGLRREAGRYALASFLVEMLDRLSPEGIKGAEAERLFSYATESLALLETTRPSSTLRLLLELRAFEALGLRPEFGRCVRCGRVPSDTLADRHQVHFHVADGGLVCSACGLRLDGLIPVALGTLRRLDAGMASPIDALTAIEVPAHSMQEAARLVFRFQRFHVGIEMRSERFLEDVLPIAEEGAA